MNEIVGCDPWELPPDTLALARDDAGNIFAVGTFQESITLGTDAPVTLTAPAGMPAMYIAKYTASGSLLWARKATAKYGVIRCKVAVDTVGNLYLSGDYSETMNFYNGGSIVATLDDPSTEYNSGYEVFLAKFSPTGELSWAKSAGGQWDDHSESLTVDSASGRLYIGGLFDGTLNLGSGASSTTLNSADDNTDPFFAQYTLDGTLLWAKQIDGGSGGVLSVAAKGTDAVLATGYYEDTITFTGTSPVTLSSGSGGRQVFVAEFSATDGQVHWAQKATGTSDCVGRAVAADATGQIYIAGDFRETCEFYDATTLFESLTSFGSNDMFMIKYQADGTPEWLHQGGGTSYDFGRDVTFNQDSNPMFIGTCGQFPVEFTVDGAGTTTSSSTSCAATYDTNGSFIEFVESGNNVIMAEESSGNSVIIGADGTVSPCAW